MNRLYQLQQIFQIVHRNANKNVSDRKKKRYKKKRKMKKKNNRMCKCEIRH